MQRLNQRTPCVTTDDFFNTILPQADILARLADGLTFEF